MNLKLCQVADIRSVAPILGPKAARAVPIRAKLAHTREPLGNAFGELWGRAAFSRTGLGRLGKCLSCLSIPNINLAAKPVGNLLTILKTGKSVRFRLK